MRRMTGTGGRSRTYLYNSINRSETDIHGKSGLTSVQQALYALPAKHSRGSHRSIAMPTTPRSNSSARRSSERTKAQFLDAAEKVFGSHGYEGTTIRAIARTARVNLGTLQHYWGSKRQLFRDLFKLRFEPLK